MVEEVTRYCFTCRKKVPKDHTDQERAKATNEGRTLEVNDHFVVVLGRHIPTAQHRARIAMLPSIDRFLLSLTIPAQYDLRNVNGVNYCPPVADQGQEGSCTGFGAYVFVGTLKRISRTWQEDISQRDIYNNARNREWNLWGEGAYMIDIMDALLEDGVCRSHYWPYKADFDNNWPCPDADGPVDALNWKIQSFADCATAKDPITAMKLAIMQFGSIDLGTPWGNSWMDAWTTGVMPVPPDNDSLAGGHSWSIIGWDDTSGVFICQNSWGVTNVMGGYFTVPYKTFVPLCKFWSNNGGYEAYSGVDAPSVDCPVGDHYDGTQCVPDGPTPPSPDPLTCIVNCFENWDGSDINALVTCIVNCIMSGIGYLYNPLVTCVINCIIHWDCQDINTLLDCVAQCYASAGRNSDADRIRKLRK